jgi:hypothetical protein
MAVDTEYTITYHLEMEGGKTLSYGLTIDRATLLSRVEMPADPPAWAKLENERCNACEYAGSAYCPIAIRLAAPLKAFNGLVSHAPAVTTVETPERFYVRKGDVQDALRSLFGLIMATSGCPRMHPFRYMARYHLPFATLDETIYRITASYLLGQVFRHADKNVLPFDMKSIQSLYNTMETLNEGMSKRLRGASEGDGALNAIVILSSYSTLIPILMDAELRKLKEMFG